MNRRDIKNKNKIADTDTGTDNELQPLQGFSEGFNSNGLNNKFGKFNGGRRNMAMFNFMSDLERHTLQKIALFSITCNTFSFNFHFVMSSFPETLHELRHVSVMLRPIIIKPRIRCFFDTACVSLVSLTHAFTAVAELSQGKNY